MKLHKMAMVVALTCLSTSSMALTFTDNDVIGPDGKAYYGMSPQNKENLLKASKNKGLKIGFNNQFFYVVSEGIISLVRVSDLADLEKNEQMELIKASMKEGITQKAVADRENGLNINVENMIERSEYLMSDTYLNEEVPVEIEKYAEAIKMRLERNDNNTESIALVASIVDTLSSNGTVGSTSGNPADPSSGGLPGPSEPIPW
jgi:hypothetical protein